MSAKGSTNENNVNSMRSDTGRKRKNVDPERACIPYDCKAPLEVDLKAMLPLPTADRFDKCNVAVVYSDRGTPREVCNSAGSRRTFDLLLLNNAMFGSRGYSGTDAEIDRSLNSLLEKCGSTRCVVLSAKDKSLDAYRQGRVGAAMAWKKSWKRKIQSARNESMA